MAHTAEHASNITGDFLTPDQLSGVREAEATVRNKGTETAITSDSLRATAPLNVPTKPVVNQQPVDKQKTNTGNGETTARTGTVVDEMLENKEDEIAEEQALTEEQQQGEDITQGLFDAVGATRGEFADRANAAQAAKDERKQLQAINSKIGALDAEIAQDDVKLIANQRAEEVRDTLLPFARSNQAKLAGDAAILRALKTSEKGVLVAQAYAKQGDIALAINEANSAVDAKYAPYKEDIAIFTKQLEVLAPTLNKQEKEQAASLLRKNTLADKEIDNLRAHQKDFISEALKNQQPELADELLRAGTLEELGKAASKIKYGNSLDDIYKRLQIEKLTSDLQPGAADELGRQTNISQGDIQKFNKEIVSSDAFKAIVKAETSLSTVSSFVELFNEVGITSGVYSPIENAKLNARYNAAVLDLKEFFNLGVLNGPDLEVIQSVLPKPTDQGFLPGKGFGLDITGGIAERAATKEGIANIYKMVDNTLDDRYATIALSYRDYSPESLGALQDAQEKYLRNKAGIDPEGYGAIIDKARRENPGITNDDLIQIINAN